MKRNRISPSPALRLATLAILLCGRPAIAQQQMDMAAYQKWAPVVVVHYVVVGEYAGETFIAANVAGVSAKATVKDRVEVTFDWDQSEMTLVGAPVVKDFPSTLTDAKPYAGCGTPKVKGAFEHATYRMFTAEGGLLNATVKRDYAPAEVAQMGDGANSCGATWVNIPAKSEAAPGGLLVIPPTYYAMPATATVKHSADGKSIIMTDGTGWTWSYTMTPVR